MAKKQTKKARRSSDEGQLSLTPEGGTPALAIRPVARIELPEDEIIIRKADPVDLDVVLRKADEPSSAAPTPETDPMRLEGVVEDDQPRGPEIKRVPNPPIHRPEPPPDEPDPALPGEWDPLIEEMALQMLSEEGSAETEEPAEVYTPRQRYRHERPLSAPNRMPEDLTSGESPAAPGGPTSWGKKAFDTPARSEAFDAAKAVGEDLRTVPVVGQVFYDREGRWRSRALWRGLLLGLAAVLAAIVVLVQLVGMTRRDDANASASPLPPVPTVLDITEVIDRFLKAPTWRDQLPYVRHSGIVEPKMRAWHDRHPYRPAKHWTHRPYRLLTHKGKDYVDADVMIDGTDRRRLTLEKSLTSGFKVDWESGAHYQEVDWELFQAERPQRSTPFRGIIVRADYYNWQFSERDAYVCWRVDRPERKGGHFFAYTKRSDPLSDKLWAETEPYFAPGDPEEKARPRGYAAIVELAYPPDSRDAQQVILKRVVQEGWVIDYDQPAAAISGIGAPTVGPSS